MVKCSIPRREFYILIFIRVFLDTTTAYVLQIKYEFKFFLVNPSLVINITARIGQGYRLRT